MGTSTMRSARGARYPRGDGLGAEFIDQYFAHFDRSRASGDRRRRGGPARHPQALASNDRRVGGPERTGWGGRTEWRGDGEHHALQPRDRLPASSMPRAPASEGDLQAVATRDGERAKPVTPLARSGACSTSSRTASRFPPRRWSQRSCSSDRDRRDVLRLDRRGGARKRSRSR